MTDIEGLWTAEGESVDAWPTSGVMIFLRNQIFGGGNRYYCTGQYRLRSGRVEIEARVYHYHGATRSALGHGAPDFTVNYHGRFLAGAGLIEGEVYRAENPSVRLPLQLVRRAALPS
jgi:hypothetical protein